MASDGLSAVEQRLRLFIYEFVIERDRCPTLNEIAVEGELAPFEAQIVLEQLADVHAAIVLSPGSPNVWLADPFAALPTPHPVYADGHCWFGMCVWDALAILAVTGLDGRAPTLCPISGEALELQVQDGDLVRKDGVVHFAVPAADWWRDVGFT